MIQSVIQGMLEHFGVDLLLGVVGLGEEPELKVCSGPMLRLEGTYATCQVGVLVPLDPGGPSYS